MEIDMFDVADRAARCVLGKWPWLYTAQDWEDAKQEALCGIIEANSPHEAIAFVSAKRAICAWLKMWLRHRSSRYVSEHDASPSPSGDGASFDLSPLRDMLIQVRTGKVNLRKIDQEMDFLRLLREGRSIDGIGMELGLSRRNTYAIRERLLPRLEMIARGEKPKRKAYIVSEASLENLRRANADPTERGKAISAAKRKKNTP